MTFTVRASLSRITFNWAAGIALACRILATELAGLAVLGVITISVGAKTDGRVEKQSIGVLAHIRRWIIADDGISLAETVMADVGVRARIRVCA